VQHIFTWIYSNTNQYTISCNTLWWTMYRWFLQFFIVLLICPLDIFYRPTRFCFIRIIRNIVCSPFYKVN
jgi:hypothetical protein